MLDPNQEHDQTMPDTAIMVEGVDYDRRDAKAGLIAIVSTAVMGVFIAMIIGVYWLYVVAYEKVEFDQYAGVASKELQAIHDREEEQLHRYSYIDKEKGIVRIPIDRAMDIVATEFAEGKVGYNTQSYAVKDELPGGAAGGANAPAPGAAPAGTTPAGTAPAAPAPAPAKPAASEHKAAH
ncbi:hypothetical protein [uncultured Paludibaculum sp.]|uniref:hypothetical protein n=1 Tax=uncultured Paludibaculum sp. TaxID=1765020 RepID=UPI002AAB7721|nr:hypothetical protein [uncultured Paludibaculum sp.]